MIDWQLSKSSPDIAKNKDRIIVVCEKCNKPREQLYQVAKSFWQINSIAASVTGDIV